MSILDACVHQARRRLPKFRVGRPLLIAIVLVLLVGAGSDAVSADPQYDFFLIEAFEVDYTLREVILRDIDESGRVSGTATHNGSYSGFVWTPQTDKVIVPMTWPLGLNDRSQIVSDGLIHDLVAGTSLQVPPAGRYPLPRLQAINDNGIAVGYSECACSNSDRVLQEALVWDGGSRILPVAGAKELLRINNGNVAVGNIRGGSAGSEGFVIDVDTGATVNLTDLLPPFMFGRGWSELQDINEAGAVTGRGWDGQFVRGLVWSQSDGFTFLPALPGGMIDRVFPRGVNASGMVVGFADLTPQNSHAFVWTPQEGMRDLNGLVTAPPGFILDWALKINDRGWIIGIGHYGPNWGTSRGFVLQPRTPPTAVDDGLAHTRLSGLGIAPNPAATDLVLRFSLSEGGVARISVFDVAGRQVAGVQEARLSAGPHAVPWSITAALPSGVYYARVEALGDVRSQRFVILR